MRLTILGMNGPFPQPGGATSGYLVTAGETTVQLDLGAGTLAKLTALTPPENLTALLFSHWHYDHCSDVLPLLYRLQATQSQIDVWGPADDASPIRRILEADRAVRLHTIAAGERVSLGEIEVEAFQARHPVPSLMYRLTANGRSLCYTGDTNTVEGLEQFAQGASLLLADGLFPENEWSEKKPHLSAKLAAQLAEKADAQLLVLTHLNPMYDQNTLLNEARTITPHVRLAAVGDAYEC